MMKSINEVIVSALKPIGLEIAEGLYEGDEEEFYTFSLADSHADDFGDNEDLSLTYYVQIHYVCPWNYDYADKVRKTRKALKSAGFTYPSLTDYSDSENRIRHYIFECAIENNFDLEEDEENE